MWPTNRDIFQNAWVVDDLEAACTSWAKELGIGPFFVTEYRGVFEEVTYHGQPGQLDMMVGLAQAGPVQIELIQPLVEKCAYRDSVPSGTGFHHMCVWSEDFAQDLQTFSQAGYGAVNTGRVRDVAFAYFDTRPLLGCMMEIVTRNKTTKGRSMHD